MIQEGMDDWVGEVQAKLNKEINSVHLSTIKSIEGIKSRPQTVCLVYMTEQHDGGQASYCEVYDREETAKVALAKFGFVQDPNRHPECLIRKHEFSSYPDTATIVPDVKVKNR